MRVFAFDHRMQLEAVADELGVAARPHRRLQAALPRGRPAGRRRPPRLRHPLRRPPRPRRALRRRRHRPLDRPPGRVPGQPPAAARGRIEPDYGSALAEWPLEHVVKVLCFYHPDDTPEMKADQEATVARLARAARANRLEFLLEIIPSKVAPVTDTTSRRDHPALLRPRRLSRLVEARADEDRRRLGERLRRDHPQRPAHPRHRRPRPRGADRRARRELRRRRPPRPRQGLRRRPHHLRRRRPGLARRRDHRRARPSTTWPRNTTASAASGTRRAARKGAAA